jgi:hypothetical protein
MQKTVQNRLDEFVDDGLARRGLGSEIGRAQCRHAGAMVAIAMRVGDAGPMSSTHRRDF